MRRRRTHQTDTPLSTSVEETEPMDENDQAQVVALLEEEGMQQIETANKIFTFACTATIIFTVIAVLLHEGSHVQKWIHAVYSSGVHWLARLHATAIPTTGQFRSSLSANSVALLIFLVLSPLLLIGAYSFTSLNEADTATLHWSLALANLIVMVCSILLRKESINTLKALELLEGSKYSYKSI